ncbi:MAG TPA: thiamine phosphate synthase [Gemmatimonadaceae bacterium]
MSRVPVVHAVTNDEVLLRGDFPGLARTVMAALGPRGAVHLRARWIAARRLYEMGLRLAEWERETGCSAIVNDRLDVACASGIESVQLTSRSVPVADAVREWPELRIGASVHAVADAIRAEESGALWCIAGSAFPTASHPGEAPAGPALLAEIADAVSLPVIGIGGVSPELVAQLLRAGVHGVATISGIWHAPDVGEAARRYLSAHDAHGGIG